MRTTTFGVGELICEAIARGATELVICLGGSATNDGALGALTALGGRFFDAEGQPVGIFGADMCRVARADFAGLNPALRGVKIRLACDVENPLCGSVGSGADNSYADAYFPILPGAMSLEEAMKAENAAENLARTAEQAMRLWLAARKR